MQDYMIQTKDRLTNVCEHKGFWLVGVTSLKSGRHLATYRLKDYPKFNSYSALVKYAKANHLDTTSQQVNDLPSDDLACVVSPSSSVELHPSNDALTDDSHSPVQSPGNFQDADSVIGSLAGESSPVAASSYPATSDTPLKSTTGEKSCDRAACPVGGANKVNVESNHDTANNNRPFFELPKLKTKPSCLAVLS